MVVVVVVVQAIILHVVYVIMPTIASVFSDTCLSNLLSLVFMTHARGGVSRECTCVNNSPICSYTVVL